MFLRTLINKSIVQHLPWRAAVDSVGLRHISVRCARHAATTVPDIDFQNEKFQMYLEQLREEFYALRVSAAGNANAYARLKQLDGIVQKLEQHRAVQGNMASKEDIENEKDEDMRQLIEEENEVYTDLLRKTEQELIQEMLTLADDEHYPAVIFEVNAGAGGQEAMLFAKELFNMYINFFEHHGWEYEIHAEDATDIGGLRHANVIVQHPAAYDYLRYEGGVHRVQRVPATEKSGRMHTSTVSVAVIPRPADVHVHIAEKDLKMETKRASGAGGQHVNTTDSAVRLVHLPTGIAVESQSERSQIKNREIALQRLQSKLLQQQLESSEAKKQASRKAQQGSLNRNEKIRTYNFVQDRITDHRIQGGTVHNLQAFLAGGEDLQSLIERLLLEQRKAKLAELIAEWQAPKEESAKSKQKN